MSLPVISIAQMREWEQQTWASGQTHEAVIRCVGEKLAARARRMCAPGARILILAGKGHNGDDARLAQPHLTDRVVELLNVTDPAVALDSLKLELARRPALVIDGLFGIGLDRPLDAAWIAFIEALNQSRLPILSVDVPSGLNADTGEALGAAVKATVTLTLGAVKKGLIAPAAHQYVGRLELAWDIGLVPCPFEGELRWIVPEVFDGYPAARAVNSHKGTFGHLALVAGSLGYHGAAVLASRGAQRARPGLITVYTAQDTYYLVASQLQACMAQPWTTGLDLAESTTAILYGPGMADPARHDSWSAVARRLWKDSLLPMIVDASALDWLSPGSLADDTPRIITPHPGEAARLLHARNEEIQAHRVAAVRELSERWGHCWVVLKGHQTLIGRSRGEIFINSSGNPNLAQGGSGDLLAGFLGGLIAQPELAADIQRALCYGVWEHGAAADKLDASRPNWRVEELADALGTARL